MSTEVISRIERMVGRSVRRDIGRMVTHVRGHLESAAASILATPMPHVGIVTGFFIEHAQPPSPETDGLGGTAHLAAALVAAGIQVTLITDAPCAKAVWAVARMVPGEVELEVSALSASSVRRLRDQLASGSRPLTHLVAIERASPGTDGKPRREHGWDMSAVTAPLHLLFDDDGWTRPWVTVGIGDGGNEIGMGALPREIVDQDIPNGPLIASRIATDHLIVAGVANWGGYALVAALAVLDEDRQALFLQNFNRQFDRSVLESAVTLGQAIDDSRPDRPGRMLMSVDRLPWETHAALLEDIRSTVLSN